MLHCYTCKIKLPKGRVFSTTRFQEIVNVVFGGKKTFRFNQICNKRIWTCRGMTQFFQGTAEPIQPWQLYQAWSGNTSTVRINEERRIVIRVFVLNDECSCFPASKHFAPHFLVPENPKNRALLKFDCSFMITSQPSSLHGNAWSAHRELQVFEKNKIIQQINNLHTGMINHKFFGTRLRLSQN